MRSVVSLLSLSIAVCLSACASEPTLLAPGTPRPVTTGPGADYPMVLGAPFAVDGVTYTPADTMNYDVVGYAEPAPGEGISGAHRTLPLPSYVEVTSLDSGRTILLRLRERGPAAGASLVSLTPAAWAQLGLPTTGKAPVRVRRVNPAEPERALLRSGQSAPERMDTPPGLLEVLKRKLGIAPTLLVPVVVLAPKAVPALAPSLPAKLQAHLHAPKPPPKAASSAHLVQIAAFSGKARAEAAAKALGGTVSPAGKFWRVRSGPYPNRPQADAALAKARAAGYADARILTTP